MSISEYVDIATAIMMLGSVVLVVIQLKVHNEQRKLDSFAKLYDINRELISLGFNNTELFEVLLDSEDVDPRLERRYLQLWFNQLSLMHAYRSRGLYPCEQPESLEADVQDFLQMKNMRSHWEAFGGYYPKAFRLFVEEMINQSNDPSS